MTNISSKSNKCSSFLMLCTKHNNPRISRDNFMHGLFERIIAAYRYTINQYTVKTQQRLILSVYHYGTPKWSWPKSDNWNVCCRMFQKCHSKTSTWPVPTSSNFRKTNRRHSWVRGILVHVIRSQIFYFYVMKKCLIF